MKTNGLITEKGVKMNECYFCKGNLTEKKVTVDYRWDNQLYIINDVPALQCNQCGEKYFSANVSEEMENMVLKGNAEKYVKIPVCKFKEAI